MVTHPGSALSCCSEIIQHRGFVPVRTSGRIESFNNQIARLIHRAGGMTNLRHLFIWEINPSGKPDGKPFLLGLFFQRGDFLVDLVTSGR